MTSPSTFTARAASLLALLAGALLVTAPASAGVLDELRNRGLGKWVDTYVEEKNGEVQLKPLKKSSLTDVRDRVTAEKPANKAATLRKKPKSKLASLKKAGKTGKAAPAVVASAAEKAEISGTQGTPGPSN